RGSYPPSDALRLDSYLTEHPGRRQPEAAEIQTGRAGRVTSFRVRQITVGFQEALDAGAKTGCGDDRSEIARRPIIECNFVVTQGLHAPEYIDMTLTDKSDCAHVDQRDF